MIRYASNVDPILINPSLLIGGCPTGFSGDSSLLQGNTPPKSDTGVDSYGVTTNKQLAQALRAADPGTLEHKGALSSH